MKQINLSITTDPKEINSLMSIQLSETGLGKQLNSEQRTKAIDQLKKIHSPVLTNKNLLSFLKSCHTYPPKISYSSGKKSFIVFYKGDYATKEIAENAHREVLSSMVGLSIQECVKRLVYLSSITQKPFNESAQDLSIRIKALAERLSIYPGDLVIATIRKLSTTEKYFPVSFVQYYEHIESLYLSRKTILVDVVNGLKAIDKN